MVTRANQETTVQGTRVALNLGQRLSTVSHRAARFIAHSWQPPDRGRPNSEPVEQSHQRLTRDQQLIVAVGQGDQRAFETLYDWYAPLVFGLSLKVLGEREVAEEAVQEVFWRVWKRAGTYDCNRMFAPWLLGIARDYCIDALRSRQVRSQPVREDTERPGLSAIPTDTDVAEMALLSEQRQMVATVLEQLMAEQRQTIELAYFGGLTQQEIADRLGNPIGTVRTDLRLGFRKLRNILWEGSQVTPKGEQCFPASVQ